LALEEKLPGAALHSRQSGPVCCAESRLIVQPAVRAHWTRSGRLVWADESFGALAAHSLNADDNDVWWNPDTWHLQLVVVCPGINDFSTALNSGEQWPTTDQPVAA